jgi:hypothetical protein
VPTKGRVAQSPKLALSLGSCGYSDWIPMAIVSYKQKARNVAVEIPKRVPGKHGNMSFPLRESL